MKFRGSIALTRALGLGPLPELLRERIGERALTQVFEREGLPVAIFDAPSTPVPLRTMIAVFDRAGHQLGERTFGLEVGEHMPYRGFGLWAEHGAQAPTLGEAIRRMNATISAHQTGGFCELGFTGRHAIWRYVAPRLYAANHQHIDHIIPPFLDFIRQYLGHTWLPDWVEVDYERDSDSALLEDRLQIPVRYGCSKSGVAIRRTELAQRRLTPISAFQRVITLSEVTAEAVLADAPEPARSISSVVALRLLDGNVDIEGTARLAGISVQSIQRHLRQKGYTYREIVEVVRCRRAVQLLCETDLPVVQVAFALGYEDHASFTRAFHRWLDTNPSEYRQRYRQTGAAAELDLPPK